LNETHENVAYSCATEILFS